MGKCKNYEMVIAKANNDNLFVFVNNFGEWELSDFKSLVGVSDFEYFLCLPQHKEACLHWLNGGGVQYKLEKEKRWTNIAPYVEIPKCKPHGFFMGTNYGYVYRIKPKKVKRVIGVNVKTGQTTSAYELDKEGNYAVDEVRLTKNSAISDWQFIEIEVEE